MQSLVISCDVIVQTFVMSFARDSSRNGSRERSYELVKDNQREKLNAVRDKFLESGTKELMIPGSFCDSQTLTLTVSFFGCDPSIFPAGSHAVES